MCTCISVYQCRSFENFIISSSCFCFSLFSAPILCHSIVGIGVSLFPFSIMPFSRLFLFSLSLHPFTLFFHKCPVLKSYFVNAFCVAALVQIGFFLCKQWQVFYFLFFLFFFFPSHISFFPLHILSKVALWLCLKFFSLESRYSYEKKKKKITKWEKNYVVC